MVKSSNKLCSGFLENIFWLESRLNFSMKVLEINPLRTLRRKLELILIVYLLICQGVENIDDFPVGLLSLVYGYLFTNM
jgi:hypothetical protein